MEPDNFMNDTSQVLALQLFMYFRDEAWPVCLPDK